MRITDDRIFEWLESEDHLLYLAPLNLLWSEMGVEHDLKTFQSAAAKLQTEKAYWSELIRESSWRHCLSGCTCLLVSRQKEFFEDLCYRFQEGSFVSPQIAVAMGLLHESAAQTFFDSILQNPTYQNYPKQLVAAHRTLLRLGIKPHQDIPIDLWKEFDRDDAMIAENVVNRHWDFWSNRV